MENCDTFNQLVKQYRESKVGNTEHGQEAVSLSARCPNNPIWPLPRLIPTSCSHAASCPIPASHGQDMKLNIEQSLLEKKSLKYDKLPLLNKVRLLLLWHSLGGDRQEAPLVSPLTSHLSPLTVPAGGALCVALPGGDFQPSAGGNDGLGLGEDAVAEGACFFLFYILQGPPVL